VWNPAGAMNKLLAVHRHQMVFTLPPDDSCVGIMACGVRAES
jgi:hypothetical protein